MEIRTLTSTTPGPQGLDALGATAAAAVTQQAPEPKTPAKPLEPAVKLDIGTNGQMWLPSAPNLAATWLSLSGIVYFTD